MIQYVFFRWKTRYFIIIVDFALLSPRNAIQVNILCTYQNQVNLFYLKELQNIILHIFCVWSLFYWMRVYTTLHFLTTLLKNFLFFLLFSVLWRTPINLHKRCIICIIIVHIVVVRYFVFLFSLIRNNLKIYKNKYLVIKKLRTAFKGTVIQIKEALINDRLYMFQKYFENFSFQLFIILH